MVLAALPSMYTRPWASESTVGPFGHLAAKIGTLALAVPAASAAAMAKHVLLGLIIRSKSNRDVRDGGRARIVPAGKAGTGT
jgi:hypothetical protein